MRPSWGHVSRHCIVCGNVGPRCHWRGGYVHKHCLTAEEQKTYEKGLAERCVSTAPKSEQR
jgi:hypothetical protein